jgi:cystathionine beta-lyase
MTDSCYGPTRNFCDKALRQLGIETSYYDPTVAGDIARLFRPNTRAVFCESPGSLTFEIQDVPAIAAAAHARGASVLLDNTWATPVFFNAIGHGVDISIQAVTKYIGGHADVMLGYITANDSHAARIGLAHEQLGLCASGDDCFLALRGLRTLSVRLARHQETGLKLARWLGGQPEVTRILHPALEPDPGHTIWRRDFKGATGLFGLELKSIAVEALHAFFDGFSIFGLGYSWGGFESLIVPAHIRRSAKGFVAGGPLLRIHAGLEDPDDLLEDLERGFARLRGRR